MRFATKNKLHWFAKYFPYLVLLHTLIFLACSNFWFKFPWTSSKLEHFVSILLKCFDSPWTTRALSETVVEESDPKALVKMNGSFDKKASVLSEDVEASVPMIPASMSRIEQGIVDHSETGVLDKKEGEQAKALFEKVKKFRTHVEEGDIVYRLYVRQTRLLPLPSCETTSRPFTSSSPTSGNTPVDLQLEEPERAAPHREP
uniref:LRRC8 pannexin-like TM region domain-containing protein n=1 Tax=Denticeps clupeoides TaxID=299321 RepID=A0AAY3ZYD9_9TELE